MKQCRGELWGETMAGVLRIVRENEKGHLVYSYQCQKCGSIIESRNRNRKVCVLPAQEDE